MDIHTTSAIITSGNTNISLDDYRCDAVEGGTPLQTAYSVRDDAVNDAFTKALDEGMEMAEAAQRANEVAENLAPVNEADFPFDPSTIDGTSITDHEGRRYFLPNTRVLGMRDGYMLFESHVTTNKTGGAHTVSFRVPMARIASFDATDTRAGNTFTDLDGALEAGCFYDEDGNLYDEETYSALCERWAKEAAERDPFPFAL